MTTHKYSILFVLLLFFSSCNRPDNEGILGIWVISSYSVNGFDCTHLVNEPHEQWLELTKNQVFRSGSIRIDNEGNWKYNSNTGIIQLSSEGGLEGWGNSHWNVTANSNNMVFNALQENGMVNILFERKQSLPVAKRYIVTEKDKIVGLWEVDSLVFDNQGKSGSGEWLRISRAGNFSSGDDSGELFTGTFDFNDSTKEVHISNLEQENIYNWKVTYDSTQSKMNFHNPISQSKLFLTRVQEFGQ